LMGQIANGSKCEKPEGISRSVSAFERGISLFQRRKNKPTAEGIIVWVCFTYLRQSS